MRWLAPEVVQTSAMDCGPAALKCLLEGHGVHASYGRLREACQTDVDGTSIDVLEDVAVQLGLDAEQVLVPVDHLLVAEAEALPALVVVLLPNGATHFLVVWNRLGPWVQVMDPGTGRRWMRVDELLEQIFVLELPLPAETFHGWTGSEAFRGALRHRIARLGCARACEGWLTAASDQELGIARLDAAVRLTDELVRAEGVARGAEARRFVDRLLDEEMPIPEVFWTARPCGEDEEGTAMMRLRGGVCVHVAGSRATSDDEPLSPELAAALDEKPEGSVRELWGWLRQDGLLAPSLVTMALALSAGGLLVEALLFRGLLDLAASLALRSQRLLAVAALVLFMLAMLALSLPIRRVTLRMGRKLEARLRLAFLQKIPRLHDRYFQSRLRSDMAERSHSIHAIRQLPQVGLALLRGGLMLALTVTGVAWLDPRTLPIAVAVAVLSVAVPLAVQPLLTERDMRMRTHTGALATFYLDAMLGLVPIRTHGAERALRREHEGLLVDWTEAGLSLQSAAVGVEGITAFTALAMSAWLLVAHLGRGGEIGVVLLLVYWSLSLPEHGRAVAMAMRQYPALRNVLVRLVEPLRAPESPRPEEPVARITAAPSIALDAVTVRASGHTILDAVDLDVEAGSHVAIVGRSGAGKSSLVGLLLGWYRASEGRVIVDGEDLDVARTDALRQATAWVDPSTHLFHRSLFDNLRYGAEGELPLRAALDEADLRGVVERLPEGLQTSLGEGGALVSGGEGQRIRLGRALLRAPAPLVILDEPFRALDRPRRRTLMARARAWWSDSTLLCITHDVEQTLSFPRVLVVDEGRVVEDGPPEALRDDPDSRYRALLDAEEAVRSGLWQSTAWRRLTLDRGTVQERESAS